MAMAPGAEYVVRCWHCAADFDALAASWCGHASPTKSCPFCLQCFCDATDDYKKQFIRSAPPELIRELGHSQSRDALKIGEILVNAGKINAEQLETALGKQRILNKKLGEVLIMMSLITPDELQLYLLNQRHFEEIDLASTEIDLSLLKRIGVDFCLEHHIVPIEIQEVKNGQVLRFAFFSPESLDKVKRSSEVGQYRLIPYLARREDIENLLQRWNTGEKEIKIFTSRDSLNHLEALNRMIRSAIEASATDMLFEFKDGKLQVFMRVFENLNRVTIPDADPAVFFERVKQVAGIRQAPRNVTFKSTLNLSREFNRLRIRTFYHAAMEQENLRFKFIDSDWLNQPVSALNLNEDEQLTWKTELSRPRGLFLFCGPNFNRLTETLYTAINSLENQRVATVETVVLQKKDRCFQVEIDGQEVTDQVYSNLLFFQPDTMVLFDASQKLYHPHFFEFVQRGKLLLEINGYSYEQVMDKLLGEYNLSPEFLAAHLRLVVFQQMARGLCPHCKRLHPTPSRQLLKHINLSREYEIYQETGCARCHYSGHGHSEMFCELCGSGEEGFRVEDLAGLRSRITAAGGLTIPQKILNRVLRGEISIQEYNRFF